jgi:hypothetical protein
MRTSTKMTTMTSRATREVPLVALKTAVWFLQRVTPSGQHEQDDLYATIEVLMNAMKAAPKKAN